MTVLVDTDFTWGLTQFFTLASQLPDRGEPKQAACKGCGVALPAVFNRGAIAVGQFVPYVNDYTVGSRLVSVALFEG